MSLNLQLNNNQKKNDKNVFGDMLIFLRLERWGTWMCAHTQESEWERATHTHTHTHTDANHGHVLHLRCSQTSPHVTGYCCFHTVLFGAEQSNLSLQSETDWWQALLRNVPVALLFVPQSLTPTLINPHLPVVLVILKTLIGLFRCVWLRLELNYTGQQHSRTDGV